MKYGLFVLILCSNLLAGEESLYRHFNQGNDAYARGEFAVAIENYKNFLKEEKSSDVYFNLGNSFFKNKQVGSAIWAYEKGLFLNPRDKDIRKNLGYIRQEFSLMEENLKFSQKLLGFVTVSTWLWIFVCIFWFLVIMIFFKRYFSKIILVVSVPIFFSILVVSGCAVYGFFDAKNLAIVLEKEVPILTSPIENSEKTGFFTEGEMIYIDARHGDFVFVKKHESKKGWVEKKHLGLIYSNYN